MPFVGQQLACFRSLPIENCLIPFSGRTKLISFEVASHTLSWSEQTTCFCMKGTKMVQLINKHWCELKRLKRSHNYLNCLIPFLGIFASIFVWNCGPQVATISNSQHEQRVGNNREFQPIWRHRFHEKHPYKTRHIDSTKAITKRVLWISKFPTSF